MTNTTNAERIRAYKARMQSAGYKRVTVWLHPYAVEKLQDVSQFHECYGRTIERLLLGKRFKREGDW